MNATQRPLIETFLDYAQVLIDAEGIYPHKMLTAPHDAPDAPITLYALDVPPAEVIAVGLANARRDGVVIFGLDRFTKPDQGIELPDFLSVYWWRRCVGWRFGVMPYRHEPRQVLPVDWANGFWTARMAAEIEVMSGATPQLAPDVGMPAPRREGGVR